MRRTELRHCISLAMAVAALFFTGRTQAIPATIQVSGKQCPYFAGQASSNTTVVNSDRVGEHLPPVVRLEGGTTVVLSATGCTSVTPSGCKPADGAATNVRSRSGYEQFGISLLTTRVSALMGVFLTDEPPSLPAPARLTGGPGAVVTQPLLQQAFYIGAGPVTIQVPAGATRLFLGTNDGYEWRNNSGMLEVTISGQKGPPWPMSRHDAQRTGRGNSVGPQHQPQEATFQISNFDDSVRLFAIGSGDILYLKTDDFLCAYKSDGAMVWAQPMGYVGSLAIGHDGRLYVFRGGSVVVCLDAVTGAEEWRWPETGNFRAFNEDLVLDGADNVYFIDGEAGALGRLRILSKDGVERGPPISAPNPGMFLSETSLAIGPDGTVFSETLASADCVGRLYLTAIDQHAPHELKWSPFNVAEIRWTTCDDFPIGAPAGIAVGADGAAYVGYYGVAPSGDCLPPCLGGDDATGSTYGINADGSKRWQDSDFAAFQNPTILIDGRVVFGGVLPGRKNEWRMQALDPATGASNIYPGIGPVLASPISDEAGNVYVVGQVVGRAPILYGFSSAQQELWQLPMPGYKSGPLLGGDGALYATTSRPAMVHIFHERQQPVSLNQLKIYVPGATPETSGTWESVESAESHFDKNFGTAVIVHGYDLIFFPEDEQLNGWLLETAGLIHCRVGTGVNVLAWDWQAEAEGWPRSAQFATPNEAAKLANQLKALFPEGYRKPVHLMGHSFGTLVVSGAALELLQPMVTSPETANVQQVTLWDPADAARWFGAADRRQLLTNQVEDLRTLGVYTDLYDGSFNEVTHHVDLWVDVPGDDHHVDRWYRETITSDPGIELRQFSDCEAVPIPGEIGFGASVLVIEPEIPARTRPAGPSCVEPGTLTLSFAPLPCLVPVGGPQQLFARQNSFLGACVQRSRPTPQHTDQTRFELTPIPRGEGGGAQASDGTVSNTLDVEVQSNWDYVTFEFQFTVALAPVMLEVSIVAGEAVYPLYAMSNTAVSAEGYVSSDLLDIAVFRGHRVQLQFDARTTEPGAGVTIQILTYWEDPDGENSIPDAQAGPDQWWYAPVGQTAIVTLDGLGTQDDDDPITLVYWWVLNGDIVAEGSVVEVALPIGIHVVTLEVLDPTDQVGTDEVVITVSSGFIRGDGNADGRVDLSDAVNTLGYLFTRAGVVTCEDAADANDDGVLDISDPVYTLGFLFLGDPPPPGPFPTAGTDPTPDGYHCGG